MMIWEMRYIKHYWDYFLYCSAAFLEGMRKTPGSVRLIDDTVEIGNGNGNLRNARQKYYFFKCLPLFPDNHQY